MVDPITRSIFNSLDADGDALLCLHEFKPFLTCFFVKGGEMQIREEFVGILADCGAQQQGIDLDIFSQLADEFSEAQLFAVVCLMNAGEDPSAHELDDPDEQMLLRAFTLLDVDGDGTLSSAELAPLLQDIAPSTDDLTGGWEEPVTLLGFAMAPPRRRLPSMAPMTLLGSTFAPPLD